jgi:single-stranded-DNA-specific exonuclease
MSPTARTKSSTKNLPPPTSSEAAFERAFREFESSHGAPSSTAHPHQAKPDGPPRALGDFVVRAFAHAEEYAADRYATIGEASQFHTKLVGVSYEGRQDTIAGLKLGEELMLERQPQNPYDPNAIAVRYGALQLGFIRKEIAKHIAPHIDAGARYRARIESLTGGGAKNRGVNIYMWRSFEASLRDAPQDDGAGVTLRNEPQASLEGLESTVKRALIGEKQPHEAQRRALERIEAGKNTLVVLGTGRGKSFCFQYPAAIRALTAHGKTLVLYPLRALANDQYEALIRTFDPLGLRIYRANGSISHDEREELFAALRAGAWDLVLATPEFLEFHREEFTGTSVPSFVVVDEAHHLYESKHRASYGRLGTTIASLGGAQVLALTATAGDDAFAHIVRELKIDAWVIDPTVRANLRVVDARETKDKFDYLLATFRNGEKGIVYCNSRKEATKLAKELRKKLGDAVMFYHAGMPSPERAETERFFRNGELRVIVATSAFGEGIDLPDVRHVVLYHLNFDFTEFNQQSGRAGRDGAHAEIHLLYGQNDRTINEFIIDREAPTLNVLRACYKGIRGLAHDGFVRMSFVDIARTLDLDKVNERTVSRALHIFEDEGLVEIGEDDDGRYVRFLQVDGKVDLAQNERFAEGEAERESFKRFCELALSARAEDLERIINRPIYPQNVELMR